MSIALQREFSVRRPADEVWHFLTSPQRIAECFPGAHLLEIRDGAFTGEVDFGLGPLRTRLRGRAEFREIDAARRTVLLVAEAREVEADGGARLGMRSRLEERGAATRVDVQLGVRLSGRLDGPILRHVLSGAAEIVFRRFAHCVRDRLEAARG